MLYFYYVAGNISTKLLHLVTMQDASFLHRQRAFGGLRATIKTSSSWSTFSSAKVCCLVLFDIKYCATTVYFSQTIRNYQPSHTILPSRSKKSCSRSLHSNMSPLFKARNARHRSLRFSSFNR